METEDPEALLRPRLNQDLLENADEDTKKKFKK